MQTSLSLKINLKLNIQVLIRMLVVVAEFKKSIVKPFVEH